MSLRQAGPVQILPDIIKNGGEVLPSVTDNAQEGGMAPEYDRSLPFIEANTKAVDIDHLREDCVIPVFSKDNEVTISHQDFINTVYDAACEVFNGERVEAPEIRVSHVVKGRIPEAMHKPVKDLLDSDRTIYYERMMFCVEIPTIHQDVSGNRLNLTLGGVRAYNTENLYSRKNAEKFKLFIGFRNLVCCNMCVSTDGYKACVRAMDLSGLMDSATSLMRSYDMERHLKVMSAYGKFRMSESQFAQLLGKTRLYQFLPAEQKRKLPVMKMTDTQASIIAKSYYSDPSFGRDMETGDVSMWKVYNLITGANKSSYIDNFLDRAQNAGELANGLCKALMGDQEYAWFLS